MSITAKWFFQHLFISLFKPFIGALNSVLTSCIVINKILNMRKIFLFLKKTLIFPLRIPKYLTLTAMQSFARVTSYVCGTWLWVEGRYARVAVTAQHGWAENLGCAQLCPSATCSVGINRKSVILEQVRVGVKAAKLACVGDPGRGIQGMLKWQEVVHEWLTPAVWDQR